MKLETCRRGHPFTAKNTRIRNGKRDCRRCAAMRERARYWAAAEGRPMPRFRALGLAIAQHEADKARAGA